MKTEAPGLYIHVPFCSSICPYCDFAVQLGDTAVRRGYVDSLIQEIELHEPGEVPFETLYFGGGTPSALNGAQLEEILSALRRRGLVDDPRVHLEANPEDIDESFLDLARRLPLSFLSLGIQSFRDDELKFLGRHHRREAALRSVELALAAGVPTVSVDLIFGLPAQSLESWSESLDIAMDSGATHISCYQLTIHEGTHFHRRLAAGRLQEMDEGTQALIFERTHEQLLERGFEAYEVSNFARGMEHQSQHNRKYWRHVPYLGLGPSAHSFDGGGRSWNLRSLSQWSQALARGDLPIEEREELSPSELATEAILLGLRQPSGLSLESFLRRFGFRLEAANERLLKLWVREGLVTLEADRLKPTLRGLAVADGLAAEIELRP